MESERTTPRDFVTNPYKILSLNGGGVRALFTAYCLKELDTLLPDFWKKFDLIIGTSAGAIVAASLWNGKAPAVTYATIQKESPKIFRSPKLRALWKWVRFSGGGIYGRKELERVVDEEVNAATFGNRNSPTLAITATYLDQVGIRVFSPVTSPNDKLVKVSDALLASMALPGAFDAYTFKEGKEEYTYIDGGLWANAPMLAAVALAIEHLNLSPSNIRLVGVGTAGKLYSPTKKQHQSKLVKSSRFNAHVSELALSASEVVAFEAVTRIVGAANVLHIDPQLTQSIEAWEYKKAIKHIEKFDQSLKKKLIDTGAISKLKLWGF